MTKNLIDLNDVRHRIRRKKPITFDGINITHSTVLGRRVVFCTDRPNDPIQSMHRKGAFYEREELQIMQRHFPFAGTLVDIGANVGNHSLFFALYGNASKIVVFEPNPLAYRLLLANIALNDLGSVIDTRHVGYGLSDQASGNFGMEDRPRNLGAAKMVPGAGSIETRIGDDLLADVTPSMIKMDVEGMELAALRGLNETIKRARPKLFVEVNVENDAAFLEWAKTMDYAVADSYQRYSMNNNYLLVPKG